ncbi:MAG: IS66 family transposase zinc-finger binding domain-containing protein [Chloroflexota bacterium]
MSFKVEPDEVTIHRPTRCPHCDEKLSGNTEAVGEGTQKRQVLDLSPLEFIMTEYQFETVTCAHCDQVTSREFPENVIQPVQYGNQIKKLSVYL